MGSRQEQNKRTAQAFYDMMFNPCFPRRAIEDFVGEVYIQHNPAIYQVVVLVAFLFALEDCSVHFVQKSKVNLYAQITG